MDVPVAHDKDEWHWFEADLCCAECGRAIGRMIEAVRTARPSGQFSPRAVFCPAGAGPAFRRLQKGEHLTCTLCGGAAVIRANQQN